MTGFGSGTAEAENMTVTAEIRSVNNRFYEFSARLPKHLQSRELELKELVKSRVKRGKANLSLSVEKQNGEGPPLKVDIDAVKAYKTLLTQLREAAGLSGEISLDTLLQFSDVFAPKEVEEADEAEWQLVLLAVQEAVEGLYEMRRKEGEELAIDLRQRIGIMDEAVNRIEKLSEGRVQEERKRLQERIAAILDSDKIDPDRLELEIALLADKLDITEELVRFRSHLKFFLEALEADESEGRKLSFLLQEMNREVNTIGSKSNHSDTAHLVVSIKEELERIREQIQNIE